MPVSSPVKWRYRLWAAGFAFCVQAAAARNPRGSPPRSLTGFSVTRKQWSYTFGLPGLPWPFVLGPMKGGWGLPPGPPLRLCTTVWPSPEVPLLPFSSARSLEGGCLLQGEESAICAVNWPVEDSRSDGGRDPGDLCALLGLASLGFCFCTRPGLHRKLCPVWEAESQKGPKEGG